MEKDLTKIAESVKFSKMPSVEQLFETFKRGLPPNTITVFQSSRQLGKSNLLMNPEFTKFIHAQYIGKQMAQRIQDMIIDINTALTDNDELAVNAMLMELGTDGIKIVHSVLDSLKIRLERELLRRG